MDENNEKKKTIEEEVWDGESISSIVKIEQVPADKDNSIQLGQLENSGWYYDQQLIQPLTSVRLFSNKTANFEDGKWNFKEIANNEYKVLLASSILSEDFSVDITNNWIDNSVDDMIGGALNSFKTITPYLGTFHRALKRMSSSQTDKVEAADKKGYKATSFIGKVVDYLGNEDKNGSKLIDSVRKTTNGAFIAQGCSFTYYGGTGVNFGNLGMKFTIFPTYDKYGNWVSVIKQVSLLLPYCMGILQDLPQELLDASAAVINDGVEKIDEGMNTSIGGFLKSITDTVKESSGGKDTKELINQYIKWQSPPGGYDIDRPKDVDVFHPGTLCLEIGSLYKIEGLVVSGLNFQFSKQMVKAPVFFSGTQDSKNDSKEDAISPLYCDVNLMLRPITKYSSQSLLKFIHGNKVLRKKVSEDVLKSLKVFEDVLNPPGD